MKLPVEVQMTADDKEPLTPCLISLHVEDKHTATLNKWAVSVWACEFYSC